jgi:hypothetical protein
MQRLQDWQPLFSSEINLGLGDKKSSCTPPGNSGHIPGEIGVGARVLSASNSK